MSSPVVNRCAVLLRETAAKWGFTVIALEVILREEFPHLKKYIWKYRTLWSPSYYVGTAGNMSAETVRRYILECQRM